MDNNNNTTTSTNSSSTDAPEAVGVTQKTIVFLSHGGLLRLGGGR